MLLAYPHITRHHQPSQQFYALPADFFPDSSKPTNSPASSQVASSLRNPDKTPLSLGSSEVVSVFEGSETRATSSGLHPEHLGDILDLSQPPELMQSEPWMLANQFTPSSAGRFSHHRESSLSSLGSAGPASPFSHPTSNPHIAVTDSTGDGFHDLQAHDGNSYYQLAKTMPAPQQNMMAAYPSFSLDQPAEMGYPVPVALQTRPRADRTLLPAPDLSVSTSRSHPASVASSIAGDSPATPSLGEPDDDNRRRKAAYGNVPKLDRTMTDIYSDELYSPNFSITSASPSHQARGVMPPSSDVFAQRLQAANSQHLSAAQSPISTTSRERSPFRQGSPLAPMPMADFNAARLGSAHRLREQRKAEQDARMLQQQLAMKSDAELPQTISPKDAILEFHESEADSQFPLFPQPQDQDLQQFKGFPSSSKEHAHASGIRTSLGPDASQEEMVFQYLPTQSMATVQVPQLYPFIAHAPQNSPSPPRLGSADSQSTESMSHSLPGKPNGASADGGTYTCTYHGCSLRFETPALLQKHKREGHRQAQGLTGSRRVEIGMTTSLLNSQAGPHRCDRINPSTGKPCNTVFSRPYDLTRHEDTIHNGRKQKVRCNLCTEEKTFSRADALTRHYRVCHPDVDFPGKHRRRVQNA